MQHVGHALVGKPGGDGGIGTKVKCMDWVGVWENRTEIFRREGHGDDIL